MNYYEHHIGDYQKKTAHLSMLEHAAYLLMLQAFYATEKALPTGKALYRIVRAESGAERKAVDSVVKQFWQSTPDGLVNDRADVELDRYREFREKQSESGKAGAKKRWGRHGGGNGNPNGGGNGLAKPSAIATPMATRIAPTPHLPLPTSHSEEPLSKSTHTSGVFSSVRAEPEAEKGSVCGTWKKIGGEAKPLNGTHVPSVPSDEAIAELRAGFARRKAERDNAGK